MKKIILMVAVAVCFVGFSANAQIGFGVKAGMNFNSSSIETAGAGGSVSDVADGGTGYFFGVFTVIKLGPLALQPEAYYSVQGMDISVDNVTSAITANYIQVPILLRLNFLKVLNIHAGPQFGFTTTKELEFTDPTTGDKIIEDLEKFTKGADISIAAGVGLNLPMGLNASLRYVQGLNDISDSADLDISSWKNAMFQLSVGYTLVGKD